MRLGTRDIARLGLLVAVAATLQVAEGLIPKPVPWLRLGLANGITLLVLVREGLGRALAVAVTRVLLAGLVLGTLGSPPFVLSATGGLLAGLVMGIAVRLALPPLSVLGVSVVGSAAHVSGQLLALAALLGIGGDVLVLGPVLMATAVPVGLVTGVVVLAVHRRVPTW